MPIPRKQPAATPQPQTPPQAAAQPLQQPQRLTFTAPQQLQPRRRWWQRLAFPAVILLCLCASFLVQSLPLGMGAIAVYAVVAWIKKLPSRYSFVMAFLSLTTVIVLLVVRQNVDLASNFSTYTFLLLVVGIISVMLESKTYPKRRNSKILNLRGQ
jgi:energy-coupling factor transporter transmembrane protein EcfT